MPGSMEMNVASSKGLCIPDSILQPLLANSISSSLQEALEILIKASRTDDGRSDLASKSIVPVTLQLTQSLHNSSASHHLLLLSLRLLRNLCAGEAANQNSFIEHYGVEIVSDVITLVGQACDDSDHLIIRTGLQVLANVSLGGERQQHAVWKQFFSDGFVRIAKLRKRECCDPLCMIIYACCNGNSDLFVELCKEPGLNIVAEIARTASTVGFGEDWLKLLLSRICLEESHFSALFPVLCPDVQLEENEDVDRGNAYFAWEQAFLLRAVSEILSERIREIHVGKDFLLFTWGIFKRAVEAVDFACRVQSGLPTGNASVDVLGYSLAILRDICAQDGSEGVDFEQSQEDAVSALLSIGLLDLLLHLLGELELPSTMRKSIKQDENLSSKPQKACPYLGFRRDIVSVIGNCLYRRKDVQDEIRQKNGILLLLQQCVVDEDNTFLREWGIWSVRNLLEDNAENQKVVADLELQGTVDVPEIAGLGLQVEVDPNTRRAKLVNVS
ncbi:hypothetical protein Ancab_037106 [Ancistrocladus abbreviatus]